MHWGIYIAGSVICFTALNILQRIVAVRAVNSRAMSFLFNLGAAFFSFLFLVASGELKDFYLPSKITAWIGLGIAVLGYGMYERGRYVAAKELDASVFSIITNLSVVVAFIGSVVLYKEYPDSKTIIGSLLILFSLVLLSYGKAERKSSLKGFLFGISISVFLGLGWMMDKLGGMNFNDSTYAFFVWTFPLFLIFFPNIPAASLRTEIKSGGKAIALLSLLNVVGYWLQLKAFSLVSATIVIPLLQTSTLLTIVIGIFFLNDSSNLNFITTRPHIF